MKESHHIDEDIIFDYKNNSPISLIEAEGIEVNDYILISLLAKTNEEKEDCYELINDLKRLDNSDFETDMESKQLVANYGSKLFISYQPRKIIYYATHENPAEWEDEVIEDVVAEIGNAKLSDYMTFRAKEILNTKF